MSEPTEPVDPVDPVGPVEPTEAVAAVDAGPDGDAVDAGAEVSEGGEPPAGARARRPWVLAAVALAVFALIAGLVAIAGGDTDDEAAESTTTAERRGAANVDTDGDGIMNADDPDDDNDSIPDAEDDDDDGDGIPDTDDTEDAIGNTGSSTDGTPPANGSTTTSTEPEGTTTTTLPYIVLPNGQTVPRPPEYKEVPPEILEAYVVAFNARCDEIFNLSPTGTMYDPESPDDVYSAADCKAELQPFWAGDYGTVEDARDAGHTDATDAAGFLTIYSIMCWSDTQCWDWSDAS
jgi:hypothetical protein